MKVIRSQPAAALHLVVLVVGGILVGACENEGEGSTAGTSGTGGVPAPALPGTAPEYGELPPVAQSDAGEALGGLCEVLLGCGCEGVEGLTMAECEEYFGSLASQAATDGAGLSYDGQCVARVVAAYGYLGCTTSSQILAHFDLLRAASELSACKLYYGPRQLGESCAALESSNGDDCLPALECVEGSCHARGHSGKEDERCEGHDACAPGLLCLPALSGPESQVCTKLPEVSQGCLWGALCSPGGYCRGEVCAPLPGAGEPCASENDIFERRCEPEAVCSGGECEPLPLGGQPCLTGQCTPGFACTVGECVAEPAAICAGGPFPLFPDG